MPRNQTPGYGCADCTQEILLWLAVDFSQFTDSDPGIAPNFNDDAKTQLICSELYYNSCRTDQTK